MAGYIANHIDGLTKTAVGIVKEWLEQEPDITDVTQIIAQTALFNKFEGTGRMAALDVADRHPEFQPVAQTIRANTSALRSAAGDEYATILSKELDTIITFLGNAGFNDDPDYYSLLAAYVGWGFKNRKEEVDPKMQEFLAVLDKQETLSERAVVNLIMTMWFWDYDGFQNRVMELASGGTTTAAAPRPNGYIAQKMDALVNLVINLAKQEGSDFTQQSIGDMLYFDWLSKRQSIAQVIAGKHPVFNSFAQKVAADDLIITNPASSPEAMRGALEQEAMQVAECNSQSELAQDVDFVSLLLVFTCWVYKDNKEEYKDAPAPFFAVLDAQSEQSPASLTNLVTALWLWDYDNFQGRVMQRIQDVINLMQKKRQEYRRQGVCQYCGGAFKGMLSKKCSVCGRPKDY